MTEVERALYRSAAVAVGVFRCPPHHERFRGGVVDTCLVALPRTAVLIEQEGRRPVVADANTAMIYNASQPYRRRMIDVRGDLCDWVAVSSEVAIEIATESGVGRGDDPENLFLVHQAPVPTAVTVAQRRLIALLEQGGTDPDLEVEELAVEIFARLLRSGVGAPDEPGRGSTATYHRHRRLVEDTKEFLALNFRQRMHLSDIATAVGSSTFHLSRVFGRATGTSIHRYVRHLRLRSALDQMIEAGSDLAAIAVDVGFSSHSHFSLWFREAFGQTPRTVRRQLSSADLEELRKIVTV